MADKAVTLEQIMGKAVNKAQNKAKADLMAETGMTPLELSRETVKRKVGTVMDTKVTPTKLEPMKEVTRGWLEEIGYDDMESLYEAHDPKVSDVSLPELMGKSAGFSDGKLALIQVLELKAGTSTRIKGREARLIEDFIKWNTANLRDMMKAKAEQVRKARFETVEIPGTDGSLYTDRTTLKRMATSVMRGRDFMLTGEPGVAKTEFALSIGNITGRKTFLMEMSGLSDPGQLIAQQHLEERNGATVTVSKPTPLVEALQAAEAGDRVVLVLDEFPRVTDPLIHNPLLLLLSHRTFTDNINGKQYKVERENFVVIATANFDAGRNFSGNNRRGVDDASLDRFRVIRINRPPRNVIPAIVAERVDMSGLTLNAQKNVLRAAEELYALATSDDVRRIITVRSVISIADAWVSLDPEFYTLSEMVQMEIEHRPGIDMAALSGVVSTLEARGL